MKKGYKRLLLFELIIFIILILNSFVWNILNKYTIILFLIVILILFKLFFGFEKDKHRYTKDILLETIIFLIIFFILYYLFGIIIGFAKTGNHYTLDGLKTFFIPIISLCVLEELLRYMIMTKAEGSKLLTCITILLFIFLDVSSAINYANFNSNYDKFIFLALTLLPSISKNISFSFLVLKMGYKPLILYQLIVNLYFYMLPIVPNPNEYLSSIIKFCIPILYIYRLHMFFLKNHDEDIVRNYQKKRMIPLSLSILVVVILVYLTSGYFHFWTIAVASGSMEPKIKKGDVVIIEKIDKKYNKLKKGDILAFKYKNVIIVHRIIKIIKQQDEYYFYTKGDANNKEDNFMVEKQMIIGKVNHKIPYIGIPTVWLNELK